MVSLSICQHHKDTGGRQRQAAALRLGSGAGRRSAEAGSAAAALQHGMPESKDDATPGHQAKRNSCVKSWRSSQEEQLCEVVKIDGSIGGRPPAGFYMPSGR
jgi:hypothetical protein